MTRDRRSLLAAGGVVVVIACVLAGCSSPRSAAGTGPTSTTAAGSAGSRRTTVYRFGVVGNGKKIARLELWKPTPVAGIHGTVVQIATSNSDGYALTSAGAVYAWGVGSGGELGNGSLRRYSTTAVRVRFPRGVKIASLANPSPFDGALAVDTRGHAWVWGLSVQGDLCVGSLVNRRPRRLPLSHVLLVTGARSHSLLDVAGRVLACGSNAGDALGAGSVGDSSKPTPVIGLPTSSLPVALTSSWEGSGVLFANGEYFDWGYNAAGQLGDGRTANAEVPARVTLPCPVRQVFQGGSGGPNGQTIAICADGSVWSWGNNEHGELGTGSTTSSDLPVRVSVPHSVTFVKVNSGGYSSYAIDSAGNLWAWGGNENGQLGIGPRSLMELLPVKVGITVTQVSATANNVAALG